MKLLQYFGIILFSVFLLGCAARDHQKDTIYGSWSGWTSSQLGPTYQRYTFHTNGIYAYNGRILMVPFIKANSTGGTYRLEEDYIIMVSGTRTNTYSYVLQSNSLKIKQPSFKAFTLKRR